jgi:hypothetical protein
MPPISRIAALLAACVLTVVMGSPLRAQQPATAEPRREVTLTVNVDRPGVRIDPGFYGLMTEEMTVDFTPN